MTAGQTADIDISVVVPTYKGGGSLPELVERTEAFFAERDLCGEIILVNDASPDGTWSVVQRIANAHPSIVGIDLLFPSRHVGSARARHRRKANARA